MKNKLIRSILLTSIMTLSLTSCKKISEDDNNKNATYININGDTFYGYEYTSPFEMNTFEPVESLVSKINLGIDTYVFTTSENCHYCVNMAPIYTEFINKNNLQIYTKAILDNDNDRSSFNSFYTSINKEYKDKYGYKYDVIDGGVPTLYYFNNKQGYDLNIYEDNKSYVKFSSYMEYTTRRTSIYEFSKIKPFKVALEKNPDSIVYLFNYTNKTNLNIYADIYKSYAKTSKKNVLLFNYHSLSEDDKKLFEKEFPTIDVNGCLMYKENVTLTIEDNVDNINKIISDYYMK